MRDYASINELICLSNLESLNAVMINDGIKQPIRLERLNDIAISQIQILNKNDIDYLDNKQLELLKTNKSLTKLSSPDKNKIA